LKSHNFYSPPNIISVIKLSSMRWVAHEERIGATRTAVGILVGKLERKS
jgi:hypothetical protein